MVTDVDEHVWCIVKTTCITCGAPISIPAMSDEDAVRIMESDHVCYACHEQIAGQVAH